MSSSLGRNLMKIKNYDYYFDLFYNSKYRWCTNNNKILTTYNNDIVYLAHQLAYFSGKINGSCWLMNEENFSKIKSKNFSIVHILNECHPYWMASAYEAFKKDLEIRKLLGEKS